MNRLNNIFLWVFAGATGLFVIMFSLYVASVLIPILLAVMAVSGLANLIMYAYGKHKSSCRGKGTLASAKKRKPEIIDVEYEIVDDK